MLLDLIAEVENEIKFDRTLPDSHPIKIKFNDMFSWLEQGGAEFHKMKIRYYSEDFRGVCARQNIKNGDTLLFVPDQKLMLKSMINGSKYGKQI